MVQAARSGVQNIAAFFVDAATSAKLELDLCNVSCKKSFGSLLFGLRITPAVSLCTVPYKSVLVANGMILLIDTASYFLKRQMQRESAIWRKTAVSRSVSANCVNRTK